MGGCTLEVCVCRDAARVNHDPPSAALASWFSLLAEHALQGRPATSSAQRSSAAGALASTCAWQITCSGPAAPSGESAANHPFCNQHMNCPRAAGLRCHRTILQRDVRLCKAKCGWPRAAGLHRHRVSLLAIISQQPISASLSSLTTCSACGGCQGSEFRPTAIVIAHATFSARPQACVGQVISAAGRWSAGSCSGAGAARAAQRRADSQLRMPVHSDSPQVHMRAVRRSGRRRLHRQAPILGAHQPRQKGGVPSSGISRPWQRHTCVQHPYGMHRLWEIRGVRCRHEKQTCCRGRWTIR